MIASGITGARKRSSGGPDEKRDDEDRRQPHAGALLEKAESGRAERDGALQDTKRGNTGGDRVGGPDEPLEARRHRLEVRDEGTQGARSDHEDGGDHQCGDREERIERTERTPDLLQAIGDRDLHKHAEQRTGDESSHGGSYLQIERSFAEREASPRLEQHEDQGAAGDRDRGDRGRGIWNGSRADRDAEDPDDHPGASNDRRENAARDRTDPRESQL